MEIIRNIDIIPTIIVDIRRNDAQTITHCGTINPRFFADILELAVVIFHQKISRFAISQRASRNPVIRTHAVHSVRENIAI